MCHEHSPKTLIRRRLARKKIASGALRKGSSSNTPHPAISMAPCPTRRRPPRRVRRGPGLLLLALQAATLLVVVTSTSRGRLFVEGQAHNSGSSATSSNTLSTDDVLILAAAFERSALTTTGDQVHSLADGDSDLGHEDWEEHQAEEVTAAANSPLGDLEEEEPRQQLQFSNGDASVEGEFTDGPDSVASAARNLNEAEQDGPSADPAGTSTGGCEPISASPPTSTRSDLSAKRPGSIAAVVISALVFIGVVIIPIGNVARNDEGFRSRSPASSRGPMAVSATLAFGPKSRNEEAWSHLSNRRPSATLAIVLMTQLQFLATLSFVGYIDEGDSFLDDLLRGLRWVNLSFRTNVFGILKSEPGEGVGAAMFVNNTVLVVAILLVMVVLHVALVSGMDAYRLTKERAKHDLNSARFGAVPVGEMWALFRGGTTVMRTSPEHDGPIGGDTSAVQSPYTSRRFVGESESDEEEGWCGSGPCHKDTRLTLPLAACRERVRPACLHFPHLELMLLFFAFEGAVASQAWAIGDGYDESPATFFLAMVALVLFPVLMTLALLRTIFLRVYPNDYIVFNEYGDGANLDAPVGRRNFLSKLRGSWCEDHKLFAWADKGQWSTDQEQSLQARREGDRFRKGFEPAFVDFTKGGTLFVVIFLVQRAAFASIAVLMDNDKLQLFLFCGIHAAAFVMVICLEPFANRVINTIVAALAAVDAIGTGLLASSTFNCPETDAAHTTNATVAALLLIVPCVLIVPVYLDAGLMMATICSDRRKKSSKNRIDPSQMKPEDEKAHEYIRNYTRRRWFRTWCTMLKQNASACVTDTREGVRTPHAPAAARSGPPPSVDKSTRSWSEDGSLHRRQRDDDVISASSAKTPTLLDDKLKTAGEMAGVWTGIATPAHRLPRNNGGMITANSFNQATVAASSGRGVIRQGEHSSAGKLASPVDVSADTFAFLSRKRIDTSTNNASPGRAPPLMVRRSANVNKTGSGREMILHGHESSWRKRNIWSMPFSTKLFGSAAREDLSSENASPAVDSPVLDFQRNGGSTPQAYLDGMESVRALEPPNRDEFPTPPRYASSILGDDPLENDEEHRRTEDSFASSGPEEAGEDRFDDGQRDGQMLQPLPQLATENPAYANRPMPERIGGNAGELTSDPFGDYLPGRFSLRTRPELGPSSSSSVSLGMPRGPDSHSCKSRASWVDDSDTIRVQGGTKGRMGAAALPRGIRCPIEMDTPLRVASMPSKHLAPAAGSEGRTDSSVSHGTDEEGSHGPRAALRGITAVFLNPTEARCPRRNSFSSAAREPPADEPDTDSVALKDIALEPKKPEQLMYLDHINWRAWDDMATLNASWKHTSSAFDQSRRGSQRRISREASKGTAASSSWRSYRSTESNLFGGNKSGARGDGETAGTSRDGSRRDIGQKPGRGGSSVLAKLVSHKRAPVQSDVPRRRSVEISLRINNGVAVVPIADEASGNGGDGSNGSAGDELKRDEARELSPANADGSTSVPERVGGGDPGLQSRTSVGPDLEPNGVGRSPRAVLGVDGADTDGSEMVQWQEEGATGRGSMTRADTAGVASPAKQGSCKDPGVDGAEQGTSICPDGFVVKGRGMGLLTQYSNGFEDASEDLNGEDEGKVAAW